jgi:hypothetical protein
VTPPFGKKGMGYLHDKYFAAELKGSYPETLSRWNHSSTAGIKSRSNVWECKSTYPLMFAQLKHFQKEQLADRLLTQT